MSLVTRCPACGTNFKVVRDQLRISDGWVRCGRCSQVFDASEDLREAVEVAPPPPADAPAVDSTPPEPPAPPEPPPLAPPAPPPLVWPGRDMLDLMGPPVSVPIAAGQKVPPAAAGIPFFGLIADEPWPSPAPSSSGAPPAVPLIASAESAPPSDLARAAGAWRTSDLAAASPPHAADLQLQKALRRARAKAAKIAKARERKAAVASAAFVPAVPQEPAATAKSVPPLASFLETRSERSRWRWPGARTPGPRLMMAIALVAALLLVLQVLRNERDVLSARQPGLRPLLSSLCAVTGCELAALRRIGSITIDGAAFARERIGDGYRLSFVLRNDAAIPLAMPAIELSLLDTQERAIVRRVILPADFGAPPVLAASAERAASLALSLSGAEAAVLPPVAGYRVVAFYP